MRATQVGLAFSILTITLLATQCSIFSPRVDYNKEVKPILNKNCISCHGGVKQSGGFSLQTRSLALSETQSGQAAILPGSASESEFIRRLSLDDPEERMPLGGPALSKKEVKLLKRWVNQGAKWGLHWAYRPLSSDPDVLTMGRASSRKYIDQEVRDRLAADELSMNPKASDPELLRRAAFDIIGMPAPENLQKSFLEGSISYSVLLDSLLSLPLFGEKWASMWLDIARYADSKGFERDPSRSIWRYRDYVIRSFNQDKPYDQFLIEQLAGDMLENPSTEQLVATGFHRNTATNDEGGTDNEEYRVKAVMDRVSTTWEGLLGTTMACTQCHGHPYDPFPQKDYYQSYAFFNNTRDSDTEEDYPRLNFLDSISTEKLKEVRKWVSNVDGTKRAEEVSDFVKVAQPIIYSIETDEHQQAALYDTKFLGLRKNGSARIPAVDFTNKEAVWINLRSKGGQLDIYLDSLNGRQIASTVLANSSDIYNLIEVELGPATGLHDVYLQYKNPMLKDDIERGLSIKWFHFGKAFPGRTSDQKQEMWQQFNALVNDDHESTLILYPNPPERRRKSNIFDRGNWQTLGDQVMPGTPSVLPPMEGEDVKTRIDFAKWIANSENPLTSRTYVNRTWEQIFGKGIVTTLEDLGSQGDLPSHPELLDRMAYDFVNDLNWSTKRLVKTIMMSETYQQSSKVGDEKLKKDRYNSLLSRGPRTRLTAEQIRDQALYLSEQLSMKMYGPPVMPSQPEGIWKIPYNKEVWKTSKGEDKYRRAIYTLIKRSSMYPALETFDMANRQLCISRRISSNTPLQALVTLNDEAFVDCAQVIAEQIAEEESISVGIKKLYFKAMNTDIAPGKLLILESLYKDTLAELGEQEDAESVASFIVANTILNLDELLNK